MSFRLFVMAFRRFGTPILLVDSLFSEVNSANCQFDSSAALVCRFIVSSCRFVVSTRPLQEAIIHVHYMKCLLDSMHLYMTYLFIICSVLTENGSLRGVHMITARLSFRGEMKSCTVFT